MLENEVFIENQILRLCRPIPSIDDANDFACWNDPDTMEAYNHKPSETLEAYMESAIQSRFCATIVRISDGARIGSIFLSQEDLPPDLAIMIYKPYRSLGYGSQAFSLGVQYCFERLKLDRIYAGCYTYNLSSLAMLKKCGFVPHPEGNQYEKHYLTGADILQLDFVKEKRDPS